MGTGPDSVMVRASASEAGGAGSNPVRVIPKTFKMIPVATLLGAQHSLASLLSVSLRPVYIQNMACVVTNEDMCSFGYLSVVHHRMHQTSSIALNERLKQTKNFIHNLIYIISA